MRTKSNLSIDELVASLTNEQLVKLIEVLQDEDKTEELFDALLFLADEIREIP